MGALIVLCFPCVSPEVPFPALFLCALGARKSESRDAFILSLCKFLAATCEMRLLTLTEEPRLTESAAIKSAQLSPQVLLEVAAQPALLQRQPMDKAREGRLKQAALAFHLHRLLLVMRRVFHACLDTSIHIAMDAGGAGGRESNLGVLFHTATQLAVWLPPVDRGQHRRSYVYFSSFFATSCIEVPKNLSSRSEDPVVPSYEAWFCPPAQVVALHSKDPPFGHSKKSFWRMSEATAHRRSRAEEARHDPNFSCARQARLLISLWRMETLVRVRQRPPSGRTIVMRKMKQPTDPDATVGRRICKPSAAHMQRHVS